jgi:hypothetical protein
MQIESETASEDAKKALACLARWLGVHGGHPACRELWSAGEQSPVPRGSDHQTENDLMTARPGSRLIVKFLKVNIIAFTAG